MPRRGPAQPLRSRRGVAARTPRRRCHGRRRSRSRRADWWGPSDAFRRGQRGPWEDSRMHQAQDGRYIAAPKAVLHDHLDGGVRPDTIRDIAEQIGHALPAATPAELDAWFVSAADSGTLERYLQTFDHTVAVMQRPEDLVRVA